MTYRKIISICILLFVYVSEITAQNLVVNTSFEDENYCEGKIPCSPSGWFSVSNWPSGYFKNVVAPLKGEQSLGFVVASNQGKKRNYWQTKVLCSPSESEPLVLKFFLYSPYNSLNRASFGFAFVDKLIKSERDTLLHFNSYIDLSKAVIKQNKNGWYEVEVSCYVPLGRNYIILGNFDTTTIFKTNSNRLRYDEYYIDQIRLTPQNKIRCDLKAAKDSIYSVITRHIKPQLAVPQTYAVSVPKRTTVGSDTFSLGIENFDLDRSIISDGTRIDSIFKTIDPASIETIHIAGFTDKSGSIEYNKKLSLARAEAVRDYILFRFVRDPSVIFTKGMGVSGKYSDDELNRRAEIIIKYKAKVEL